MFKLRPYQSMLVTAVLIGLVGGLLSAYFFTEDAYNDSVNRAWPTLIVTAVIIIAMVIAAFSRYGFKHLHHRRPGYKRG